MRTAHGIFCVLALAFLFSCGNSMKDVEAMSLSKNTPEEKLNDARLIYTDSGRVKAVLTSVELQHFTVGKKGFLFPRGLQVEFYDINGVCEARVTSRYGDYDELAGELLLQDHVRFINFKQRDTLFTEYLIWRRKTQKIFTDRAVEVHSPEGKLIGDGLTANENLTRYVWVNPRGEYYVNENDTTSNEENSP